MIQTYYLWKNCAIIKQCVLLITEINFDVLETCTETSYVVIFKSFFHLINGEEKNHPNALFFQKVGVIFF